MVTCYNAGTRGYRFLERTDQWKKPDAARGARPRSRSARSTKTVRPATGADHPAPSAIDRLTPLATPATRQSATNTTVVAASSAATTNADTGLVAGMPPKVPPGYRQRHIDECLLPRPVQRSRDHHCGTGGAWAFKGPIFDRTRCAGPAQPERRRSLRPRLLRTSVAGTESSSRRHFHPANANVKAL